MLSFCCLKLTVEKLVYGGDGLSRIDGEVVLTPLVLPGEVVEAAEAGDGTSRGPRSKVRRARVISIDQPSPARILPDCAVFGRCGGCHYQHIEYQAQLELRRQILAETLRRTGKIEIDVGAIQTVAGEPFGYRNRAQFHFPDRRPSASRTGTPRIGYRALGSRELVPIDRCPISSPRINEIIGILNRMVRDPRWPNFIESLEVFTDETSVQWNVLETSRPVAARFFEWLAAEVPGTVSGPLDYRVGDDRFRVSGNSFFQVNRRLLPELPGLVLGEALRGTTGAEAWDLYAGVGLFCSSWRGGSHR